MLCYVHWTFYKSLLSLYLSLVLIINIYFESFSICGLIIITNLAGFPYFCKILKNFYETNVYEVKTKKK